MDVKKGVKNILYSILSQVIALALGIVIPRLIITSPEYGSETNGLLSFAHQALSYLALLEAGIGAAALQAMYKPIAESDKDSINGIMSATHRYYRRTGTLYFIGIIGLSFIYPLIVKSSLNYWFMAIVLFVTGIPNVINFFFQGKLKILLNAHGDNYILTNLSTITTTLASVSKIILLVCGANIIFVQTMYCGISLIQMIFIFAFVKKKYGWVNYKVEPNKESLKQKSFALIHQIAGLVTNSTDVILISIFCGFEVASIYAVYNMMYNLVYNVSQSVNNGLQFVFGQKFASDKEGYKTFINAYETYYTALCGALMTVTYILIIPFIRLYLSGADIDYINIWLPMLFTAVHLFNSMRNASANTNSVAGHFKQTSWFAIAEAGINLSLSIVGIIFLGLPGVLIGTVVAYLFRNIVDTNYANKKVLNRKNTHFITTFIVNVSLVVGLCLISHLINFNVGSIWLLIPIAVGVTAVCVSVFFTVNSVVDIKSFKIIKARITKKFKRKSIDRA